MDAKLERLSVADTIRAITFAEVVVLVMDATHPFETQDLQIADLVEREGRSLVFVLAKFDLMEEPGAALKEAVETAGRLLPQVRGTPVVALSAETGRHLDRLMPAVIKAHADWSTKLKTRDLNDWLSLATQRHPPPAVNGRRIKPKYIAQTKARPPTFVLFCTRADQLPDSYRRYMINSLRESFDMPGTPMRLTVKSSSKNPYEGLSDTPVAKAKRTYARGPRKTAGKGSRPAKTADRPSFGKMEPKAKSRGPRPPLRPKTPSRSPSRGGPGPKPRG